MFLHDFAEVQSSFDAVSDALAALPELLSELIGPAFDLSVADRSGPWPVSYGVPRPRDDGWVYPVWWPGGRGGLVPAVEADLGFFPRDAYSCHVELMGTYARGVELTPVQGRRAHQETVLGIRRLLQRLADELGRPAIPSGPVPATNHAGPGSNARSGSHASSGDTDSVP